MHYDLIVIIFDLPLDQIIFTQNKVFSKGHNETYHSQLDDLLQFHQVERSFNHFDKFYLKARKLFGFSMHECNAHIWVQLISKLYCWDVTPCQKTTKYPFAKYSQEFPAPYHCSASSAPHWDRHSYLSKVLRYTPYTCGSSRLFSGAFVGD